MSTYIYESPDGGNTVYRRLPGKPRELLFESAEQRRLTDQAKQRELWNKIHQSAESDPILKNMLDQIIVYHTLKNTP